MTLRTKVIGRNQTDHGPWVPGTVAGKKFHYQLFGCDWESLHDNNNTPPAVWDGGDIITPNTNDWKKVSGDYQAWLLKQNHPATTGTTGDYPYNGMGRVELAKNMVNTGTELAPVYENQLTQDMFYKGAAGSRVPNTNTIFVIRYDYILAENITIPSGCVLQFDGGSISGVYTITGANTGIKAVLVKIFDTAITLAGSWNVAEAYLEWFGAKGDGVTDDTTALQKTINSFSKTVITNGTYLFSSQISISNDKTITGINEVQDNGSIILKTASNITCLKFTGNRNTVENIKIQHPETNTAPVIDFTGCRYINLRNIILDHNAQYCPAIGLYCEDVAENPNDWTGYDVFANCYISDYSENVRIETGTLVTFYNCKFNCSSSTTRSLYLKGSIYALIGCDITKPAAATCIGLEYDGGYIIDVIGCYLEGFYIETFAKVNDTYGAGINLSGSRFFINTTGGNNAKRVDTLPNRYFKPYQVPEFANGFHSSVNHLINGNFSLDFIKWVIPVTTTASKITNAALLPKGQKCGGKFVSDSGAGEIYNIIGKLSKGIHTICYWIKVDEPTSAFDTEVMLSDGTAGSAYVVADRRERNSDAYSGWTFVMMTFEVPEDKADVNWYLRFYFAGCPTLNLTGISVYDGVYTESEVGSSCCEEQVATKSLIIKGDNGNFYSISVDSGGNLTATQI